MHGTVPAKVGRLVADLMLHPQYISRCLAHNLFNGKTPLDLELPWFSYAAIDFLNQYLKPHMTVCECASRGVSSIFSLMPTLHWIFAAGHLPLQVLIEEINT